MQTYQNDVAFTPAVKAILTETVPYEFEGTRLVGFLAYDANTKGRRPGVLVFPEWWGVNETAKTRAIQLAEHGYVSFVADVYGDGRLIDIDRPEEAMTAAGELRANPSVWRGRATAAMRTLAEHPGVDPMNLASIGHCLDSALQLAYTGADVKAVATFHSAMPTPTVAEARAIKAKMLVCLGGADPFIPKKAIEDFRLALNASGVKFEIVTYSGVLHSFTSPTANKVGNPGMKYDRNADEDSWRRMKELFAQTFADPT